MFIIKEINTLLVDIPTIRAHKLSVTVMKNQTLVLVHIVCDDGIEGWGEATTIGGLNYAEESPVAIKKNIDTYITPLLLNKTFSHPNVVMNLLDSHIKGNRFAKCAIETSILDSYAKRLNIRVADLLGGVLNESLPVAWTLASGDTKSDIEEGFKMIESKRHNIFKLKIGLREWKKDVAHVLEIKKALGDNISIRVDVNQAWSELDSIKAIKALEEGNIDLIEQPVSINNKEALRRLTNRFDVAIMADEALLGIYNAYELAHGHYADVFAIKINQAGGLYNATFIGNLAKTAGISLYGGTMLEGSIGTMASMHVFSTFANLEFGTELFGPLLLTEEILLTPLEYKDFKLYLPKESGLGIQIDKDKVYCLANK